MRIVVLLFSCMLALSSFAQQTNPFTKFGKVEAKDLERKVYNLDSNAEAVVLSDIGITSIDGNNKGWFSTNFKRHRVVHILNKNGYDKADVEILLYNNGDSEEKLEGLKATTYNLENGKVVETKLEKSAQFKEKISKNRTRIKFTMPNVKEGCIIEYEYKVSSDFISNLDTWYFQGSAPTLWSEYQLSLPEFFYYSFLSHGYHSMAVNEKKDRQGSFTVMDTRGAGSSDRVSFNAGVTDYRWAMINIPALKQESFTSSIKNHIASMDFQLISQSYPLTPRDYRSNWGSLVKSLRESEYFGATLYKDNNWMSDDLQPVFAKEDADLIKARKLYYFIQDNFTCTGNSGFGLSQSLKNTMKTRKGSVADLNLLLTAMLRYANLNADPVLLSTTDHGYALEMFPMLTNFNYVVCQLKLANRVVYLDAGHSGLGFGKLLPKCFNGHARVVDEQATPVSFTADSLLERKVSAVFINNDDKGKWVGSMNQTSGYFESFSIRHKVREKGMDALVADISKELGVEAKISNMRIDSLKRYDDPVSLKFEMEIDHKGEEIIYINPLFGEALKDNPFKSPERYYPVEMPYTVDETFILSMEVPAGYEVDELPKQMIAKLDEEESAYFEYRLTQSNNTISMRTRIKIKRTLFLPEEYPVLREFFNMIVKKQNEQIVFKKKK